MLALPYKKYIYSYNGDFRINGEAVILSMPREIRSAPDAEHGDTGVAVWDAAVVLARYIESNPEIVKNRNVIELGSGLGLLGMSAARCAATSVTLTDLPYILGTTVTNIGFNNLSSLVDVAALDWENPAACTIDFSQVEVILASDTIWLEELIEPFVKTLEFIRSRAGRAISIYISNQLRSQQVFDKFQERSRRSFDMTQMHTDSSIDIFKLVSVG